MKTFVLQGSNTEVTSFYLTTIARAFQKAGFSCEVVNEIDYKSCVKKADRNDVFVAPSAVCACKLFALGVKRVVFWSQGVVPEESYLRNHSKLREAVLSMCEKGALQKSALCFFVSNEMRAHYERKYGLHFEGKHFIMPCFNDALSSSSIFTSGKYDRLTFAYVGSLAKWQCFPETVELYREIERRTTGAHLKVLTFDQLNAKKVIEGAGVESFEVGCVPPEQVAGELASCSFGFVVRDDTVVNRVATPTKLSSYLAAGVIPIFSSCLKGFAEASRQMRYVFKLSDSEEIDRLVEFCNQKIKAEDVFSEYSKLFSGYYSQSRYINDIAPLVRSLFC